MSGSRRWLRRALLSMLAGGGLTAAGLSGPLAGGALGADTPTTTTGTIAESPQTTDTSTQETPPPSTTPTNTTSTSTQTTTTDSSTPPPSTTTESTPTTTTPAPAAPPETTTTQQTPTPAVERQHTQKPSVGAGQTTTQTETTPAAITAPAGTGQGASTEGSGNVAPAPQMIAGQGDTLSALLANSTVSVKALQFFQVPLFLLPIYQAAAIQYGVPWEILAAINEVETDYGTDLNVSTAGAVGWMQFEPATWLQYGVDALNAGYADPYNPVDAIFAAARYLRAAGAAKDLRDAIFAYNHSNAYVESVLLRARLLTSYPQSVLDTLTGLTEGSVPVAGTKVLRTPVDTTDPSSATTSNGSPTAPAPSASAQSTLGRSPTQFTDLIASSGAPVVAVEDGRVTALGNSHKLGRYLVLRDVYGDVFTYAGLGSLASTFKVAKATSVNVPKSVSLSAQTSGDPAPTLAASAGHQPESSTAQNEPETPSSQAPPTVGGKVRLFAHPNNPDAIAATDRQAKASPDGWLALRRGSVLPQGTVVGHLAGLAGDGTAQLRFAIRPAGDQSTIDPQPILENWKQLNAALHPQGAKAGNALIGATADDVFLLSSGELERAVLSDPGITLSACDRQEIASGASKSGVLAALLFLSRSGLKPTVSGLRCGQSKYTSSGAISPYYRGDAVSISAVNGVSIANHQGAGTVTDITIRTLLTLQGQFAPARIISLMRYPGAHSTVARPDHGDYIELEFPRTGGALAVNAATTAAVSRSGANGKTAPSPLAVSGNLTSAQWNQLITRIGSLQMPKVATKPSKAAIRDPQAAKTNQDLGTHTLP